MISRRQQKVSGVVCTAMVALSITGLVASGGCGSGGGKSSAPTSESVSGSIVTSTPSAASNRGTGRARVSLLWPGSPQQTASSDPASSNSVQITLTQNGQVIEGSSRLLTRPSADGNGDLTGAATWDDLPVGDVTVSATAYSSTDGTGTGIAQASVVVVVEDAAVKSVSLTLQSAVDHLQITMGALVDATNQNPATIFKGDELPLAVSSVDKNNRVVLVNGAAFQWTCSDSTNAPVSTPTAPTSVLLARNPTVATVSVTDTRSGKKTVVSVPVTGFAVGQAYSAGQINNAGWLLSGSDVRKPPYTTPLSVLPSDSANTIGISASSLNNGGQVVGYAGGLGNVGLFGLPTPDTPSTPFLWQESSGAHPLTATSGETIQSAQSINDAGQILVGYVVTENGVPQSGTGVLDINTGRVTRLPNTATENGRTGQLSATSITNSGQVLGYGSFFGATEGHLTGIVQSAATGLVQFVTPLPGSGSTHALSGNPSGVVVGDSYGQSNPPNDYGNDFHAIYWTAAGGTVALPSLPNSTDSGASSINARGYIAGYAVVSGQMTAVLWRNNHPYDINKMLVGVDASLYLSRAVAINDQNRILAAGAPGTTLVLVPVTGKAAQ